MYGIGIGGESAVVVCAQTIAGCMCASFHSGVTICAIVLQVTLIDTPEAGQFYIGVGQVVPAVSVLVV